MSNRGEPWRKFVQTFFLAEQPGGYFVLNDIFRFLKEDAVDDDGVPEHAEPDASPAVSAPEPVAQSSAAPPVPIERTPTPEAPAPEPVAPVEEARVPTPEPEPHVNGVDEEEPEAEEPEAPEPEPEATPEPEVEEPAPAAAEAPQPAASPAPAAQPPAPAAAPAPQQQPTPATTPAPIPAPAQPAAPAAPKTWANLAAANSKKWGSAVATDSRGTSEAPPPVPTPTRQPQTPTMGAGRGLPPRGDKEGHPLFVAAQGLTTPQCFVKVSQLFTIWIGSMLMRAHIGCYRASLAATAHSGSHSALWPDQGCRDRPH